MRARAVTAPFNPSHDTSDFPRLGGIVAELRDLRVRSHRTRYGGGPLPALPSRVAMIGVIDGLAAALFPRHFGPPGLAGDSLDGFVAFTLTTTLQVLQAQMRLELDLAAQDGAEAEHAQRALQTARQFADDLPGIRAQLETDIRAAYEGDPAATSVDEVMCCYPGVTTSASKAAGLAAAGASAVVAARFDAELAAMPAATFVERVLVGSLGAKRVVVGHDYRLGRKREGDIRHLGQLADRFGFELVVAPELKNRHGERFSSSRVRELLAAGELTTAADLLGRPWRIQGEAATDQTGDVRLAFDTLLRPPQGGYRVTLDQPGRGSVEGEAAFDGETLGLTGLAEPGPVRVQLLDWIGRRSRDPAATRNFSLAKS
jgi:hypothetical protein